jgi:threonine dehydrogenase-like Zn-dependent dehydrogenase
LQNIPVIVLTSATSFFAFIYLFAIATKLIYWPMTSLPTMPTFEIVIVGAGIVGLAASIGITKKKGHKVIMSPRSPSYIIIDKY